MLACSGSTREDVRGELEGAVIIDVGNDQQCSDALK